MTEVVGPNVKMMQSMLFIKSEGKPSGRTGLEHSLSLSSICAVGSMFVGMGPFLNARTDPMLVWM